jgi:hypothetical protein
MDTNTLISTFADEEAWPLVVTRSTSFLTTSHPSNVIRRSPRWGFSERSCVRSECNPPVMSVDCFEGGDLSVEVTNDEH